MKSIDIFNAATIEIFRICLEEFPSDVALDHRTIGKVAAEFFSEPTRPEERFNHKVSIEIKTQDTIKWLTREGYIRLTQRYLADDCWYVVTPKGLNAANIKIEGLESKPTFGEAIQDGLKAITIATMPTIVSSIFK